MKPLLAAQCAQFTAPPQMLDVVVVSDEAFVVVRAEGEQVLIELWRLDDTRQSLWCADSVENPLIAVSPEGDQMVLALGCVMHLFLLSTGAHIRSWGTALAGAEMCRLRWSSDDRLFSLATDHVVRMWSPSDGVCLAAWPMRPGQDFCDDGALATEAQAVHTEHEVLGGRWIGRLIRAETGATVHEVSHDLSCGSLEFSQVVIRPNTLALAAMFLLTDGRQRWSELHLWERGEHVFLGEYFRAGEAEGQMPISTIQFVGPDLLHYCGWGEQGVWDVAARVDRLSVWRGRFSRNGLMLGADGLLNDLTTGQRLQLGRSPAAQSGISPSGGLVVLSQGERLVGWRLHR
ncbi:hypothetical protein L6R46_05675 [Myxococcota bacterium]|nr:hypothetical protein [Myxococcota bacterium]